MLVTTADPNLIEQVARRYGLGVAAVYPLFSIRAALVLFLIPDNRAPADVAVALRREPQVIEADVNTIYETQGDPLASRQYAIRLLGADRAHSVLRGRNITVATVDTGVDAAHEDLQGAIVQQQDLVEDAAGAPVGVHGTQVVGIIAARADNGLGIVGVAPEARIVLLQACVPRESEGSTAACTALRVARGIDLAVRYRAQILNLSLGGPRNNIVSRLVLQDIYVHNIAVVAAAGNNGPDGPTLYPAALPGVVAVGATDSSDGIYERSNASAQVSIFAPGVDILSTSPGNRYAFVTGTSYAAAIVSGALAILMEAGRTRTSADVITALRMGAVTGAAHNPGRIDLCRSLTLLGRPEVCP